MGGADITVACEAAAVQGTTIATTPARGPDPSLVALCTLARLHQIAADPSTLAHQLGLSPGDAVDTTIVLRAAKQLGLKAKLSRTTLDRLALTPLPALALLRSEEGETRCVILAQCDAQRVLLQDPSAASSGPVIEPLDVFAAMDQ